MLTSSRKNRAAAAIVADALGIPKSDIPSDARMGAFEPWDSLGHLRIMMALEESLGRELGTEEAIKIECVADIAEALKPQST